MDDLSLLIDLHGVHDRQGPGGASTTWRALDLSGLAERRDLVVADVGCGTGASTLVLADALDASITAVDLFPAFLDTLRSRADAAGVGPRVATLEASMQALPFEEGTLDAIWSEGAIYNMGFAHGVAAWRPLLKDRGILAVSELTWLTAERHAPLQAYWDTEYPEVGTASEKLAVLEANGFTVLGYFPLPVTCWEEQFYEPLEAGLEAFVGRHRHSEAALAVAAATVEEISLYRAYASHVSYGFYIAEKR